MADHPRPVPLRPFALERYFAAYEFSAPHLLCCSDCEPLSMKEVLAMADRECRNLWSNLSLGYTESQGLPLLRKEIARCYGAELIKEDNVLVLAPEEGIFLAMHTILKPGDRVVVTTPGYQSLSEVARSLGCEVHEWRCREVAEDGGGRGLSFLPEDLEALLSPGGVKLVVINFPHNPTGATLTRTDFARVITMCEGSGALIFSDEMYRGLEFNARDRLPSACEVSSSAVSLCGMSKVLAMPGLRVGWLVTRDVSLLGQVAHLKDYTTICTSAPSEVLALIGLRNRDTILARNMGILRNGRDATQAFMEAHDDLFEWCPPRAGSIAFPRLKRMPQLLGDPGIAEGEGKDSPRLATAGVTTDAAVASAALAAATAPTATMSTSSPLIVLDEGKSGTPRSMVDASQFCRDLVERTGILLLPASVYEWDGEDRFRIGLGRRDVADNLERLATVLRRGGQDSGTDGPALPAEHPRLRGRGSTADSTSSVRGRTRSGSSVILSREAFMKHHYRSVHEDYQITMSKADCLGSGCSGTVRRATRRDTGIAYACKSVSKDSMKNVQSFLKEITLLKALDHPNIVRLIESYEDEHKIYIIMELCTGGELFDRLEERDHFSEKDAAVLVAKMVRAVGYCHSRGLCHRDLKLENFMFESPDEAAEIKLIDFGLSRVYQDHDGGGADDPAGRAIRMKSVVGTSYYIAPEVLRGNYTQACDMWSLGVITYVILCGYPPFNGHTNAEIFRKISRGVFKFKQQVWTRRSDDLKDFIRRLLEPKIEERMTAAEALKHPWLAAVPASPVRKPSGAAASGAPERRSTTGSIDREEGSGVLQSLRAFAAASTIKKTVLTFLAMNLDSEQLTRLRDIFVKIDTEQSGVITYDELRDALAECDLVDDDGEVNLHSSGGHAPPVRHAAADEGKGEVATTRSSSLREIFRNLDENDSGTIQYSEFLAATVQMQVTLDEESLLGIFKQLDVSKTNSITLEDMRTALGSVFPEEHIENIMQRADLDENKVISLKEFVRLIRDDSAESQRHLMGPLLASSDGVEASPLPTLGSLARQSSFGYEG